MNAAKIIRFLTLSLFVVTMAGTLLMVARQLRPLVATIVAGTVVNEQAAANATPRARPSQTATVPRPPAAQRSPTATLVQLDQLLQSTVQSPTVTRTPTPTVTPAPTAPPRLAAIVNVDLANVRNGPGTAYAIVGQAQNQATVELIGRSAEGDWWQLCCQTAGQDEQWISAELVELAPEATRSLKQLPIVTPLPLPTPAPRAAAGESGGSGSGGSGTGTGAGLPASGSFSPPGGVNGLTGLPLPAERAGQRPLIVCVNNDPAARPQLGLGQADIVYEYLMEGYGITRFSAIFYGEEAGQIGPVRSARLINYYMGALYGAGLICSGASDQVRYSLKHEAPFPYMDIDLDDPSNSRYSVSIGSDYRTRLRTSTAGGRRWLADWGVEQAPNLRGFTFGSLSGGGSPAQAVNIPYPYGSTASYRYDSSSGRYLRSLGGVPHVDGNTGVQLAVENVIVQVVPHEATNIVEDSLGSTSIRLNLFGSGRAYLFRDGQVLIGTWRSESRGDLPRFYSDSGQELTLKPGKSWISIVPPTYAIEY